MSFIRVKRPVIIDRLPRSGHVVLEASAGTGKTHTLERVVVHLLLEVGATIDQILVVTFTERATKELRARIRKTLLELSRASEDEAAESFWRIDAEARMKLEAALSAFDQASISTIHGFCQRALTEHAFTGRRLFEEETIDGKDAFGRAFREELRRALVGPSLLTDVLAELLRGDRAEAIEAELYACHRERSPITPAWDPATLIAACRGLPTESDLTAELRRHFKRLGPQALKALHEHAVEIYPLAKACTGDREALDFGAAFEAFAAKGLRRDEKEIARLDHLRKTLAEARTISPVIAQYLAALEVIETCAPTRISFLVAELLPAVRARLEGQKRSRGQTDFDDMLELLRRALVDDPSRERAKAALLRRHPYALIDEFQDTDETQWAIFRALFFERGRMFLIGDPKQAIYGFRNADVRTYLSAKKEIIDAGGAYLPLVENYRSTPALIDVQNTVFERGFFTPPNRYSEKIRPGRPELELFGRDGVAEPVELLHLYSVGRALSAPLVRAGLGAAIAERVKAIRAGGLRLGDAPIRGAHIHVLVRTQAEGEHVARSLRRHGVAHAFYRQEGLFESEEAEDVFTVLSALARPDDPSLRVRAFLTPFFGVPLRELPAAAELEDDHRWVRQLERLRGLAEARSYARLFDALIEETGLLRRLLFHKAGERELTNYLHVFELLRDEARRGHGGLPELCRALRQWRDRKRVPAARDADVQRAEGSPDAVQILTMHKAKGLEADVVFLAGGFTAYRGRRGPEVHHQGGVRAAHIGPRVGRIGEAIAAEEQEETERLMYVALTRAKGRLVMPYFGPPIGAERLPDRAETELAALFGPYRVVNQRLRALALELGADRFQARFKVSPVPCEMEYAEARRRKERDPIDGLSADLPPVPPDPAIAAEALARRQRRFVLTSYTRLAQAGHDPLESERAVSDLIEAIDAQAVTVPPGGLPPGRISGIFLHGVLEDLDFRLAKVASLDEFRTHPDVGAILTRRARELGLDEAHLPAAAEIVHRALRTPILRGTLALAGGLAEVEERVAELEFVFPIPERTHPKLELEGPADSAPYWAERGFIRGVIDLVFEHDGRYYFLDYKSDLLESFDEGALAAHVAEAYALQAEIYALAVARILGIRDRADYEAKFGGVLYCFLRAMDPNSPGSGVTFSRPTYDQLMSWERELARPESTVFGGPS